MAQHKTSWLVIMSPPAAAIAIMIGVAIDSHLKEQREHTIELVEPVQMLTVGVDDPCQVEVPLESWDSLNQMKIYRWVVACEDTNKESQIAE